MIQFIFLVHETAPGNPHKSPIAMLMHNTRHIDQTMICMNTFHFVSLLS